MINSSLLYFDTFVKSITVFLILLIFILFMYLICLAIKVNSEKIKEKKIVGLNILANSTKLGKFISILSYLIYIVFIILSIHSLYLFFKFDFSLQLASKCELLMNYYYNDNKKIWLVYDVITKNKKTLIENIHDNIGAISVVFINYYRTLYVLYIESFPIWLKLLIGSILGILVRNCSYFIIDLFGTNNKQLSTEGYTFETLFYQYNFCLNLMVMILIVIVILLLIEYFLINYTNDIKKTRNSIEIRKIKESNGFFNKIKASFYNLKLCLVYYKWDILLIVIKILITLTGFAYFNSILFLSFHPLPKALVEII